jgi:hypothetical protein
MAALSALPNSLATLAVEVTAVATSVLERVRRIAEPVATAVVTRRTGREAASELTSVSVSAQVLET